MSYRDLREYLHRLEQKGLLCHVEAEVDKDWEISAICRQTFRTIPQHQRPALMFDRILGSDIPLVVGILGGSREIYATALDTDVEHIWETWERGKSPIPPRVVEHGPCQEVVLLGEDANLEILPAPIWTVEHDPGPYHSSPFIVTRDPETGVPNLGTYRVQVKGRRRAGIMINPNRHMMIHIEKNEALGQNTDVAIVLGTDPVVGLTSVSPFPYGVNELAAAGGIRGEAVDVVRCKTMDLLVPATAEIIIEGTIRCGAREAEGPFGEYAGYMGTGGNNPLFEVSCITHRRNPIYQAFLSQMPPSESSCIKSMGREMEIRRHLKNNLSLPVKDVYVTESSGAAARVIISLKKANRFQPLKAILGVWSLGFAIGKTVIVVDDDIDVRDSFWVEWALSFRMQPAEDILIQKGTDPITLDPSQPLRDGRQVEPADQVSSRVGIDATRKHPYPNLAIPPREHLERVSRQWDSYGIKPISDR
jgi:UbiD family decarboxylase